MEISEKQNVNEFVTEHFINDLKAGRIPWRRPWTLEGVPFNPVTKLPYTGINQLLLASLGYPTNFFLTFKQIMDLEAKVKPGERGYSIVLWKKGEAEGEKYKLLSYSVFNATQCNDLPEEYPEIQLPENPYQRAEEIKAGIPLMPKIIFADGEPMYHNFSDSIYMPLMKAFKDRDQYFYTLYYELVVATGNEKRLNRKEVANQYAYNSRQYALRQLTAEIGAWQLASIAGIKIPLPGYSSNYIQYWIESLERDRYLAINAAMSAQKAVNYILNVKKAEATAEEHVPTAEAEVALNGEFFEPLHAGESVKNVDTLGGEPPASPKTSKKKRHESQ